MNDQQQRSAAPQDARRLAVADLPDECAVVVVGSGFGASVAAARIAAEVGSGDTVVLERGREWLPGEFPESFADMRTSLRSRRNPLGLFDFVFGSDVDRLTANGLGGGSLIYANVLLEPHDSAFAANWPSGIDRETLRPYYRRVRSVLRPEVYLDPADVADGPSVPAGALDGSEFADVVTDPEARAARADWSDRTGVLRPTIGKAEPLGALAAERDRPLRRVPVAINLTTKPGPNAAGVVQPRCTLCGNCVTGCNVGAKTTMWASYLPMAVDAGARIVTGIEVEFVRPSDRPGRRWAVEGVRYEDRGGRIRSSRFVLHTDVVVLGAGALGTTGILLRTGAVGLPLSSAVGRRFSGNADSLGVSYNSSQRSTGTGARDAAMPDVEVGPTITSMLDMRTGDGRGHLVQDGALPHAVAEALRRVLGLRFALSGDRKVWCDLRPGGCPPGCGALEHSQVWLAMGADSSDGRVELDRRGRPRIVWMDSGRQDVYRDQLEDLRALTGDGTKATFIGNPRHALAGRGLPAVTPITVHPLGGAVMADDHRDGACDPDGRVYDADGGTHDGLYVVDGALVPAATGANPSLTIAALAERVSERLVSDHLARLVHGVSEIGAGR